MKVKYLFLLPLLLTSCLSSGGNDSATSGAYSPRGPSNSTNRPASTSTDLNTFINPDKFKDDVIAQNNSNIKTALETAKISANTTNINIATEALQANVTNTNYISSKITKLNNVIDSYENNYKSKLASYTKSQTTYAPLCYDGSYTQRGAGESDASFATKLYQIVQDKYADYEQSKDQYILQTLYYWANDIKTAVNSAIVLDGSSTSTIEAQFLSLYTQLRNLINTATTDYNNAKSDLLSKMSSIDSSITDFPLSIDALINYYKLEKSILNAISSVDYLPPPTATSTQYTASSMSDTDDKKSVKFEYSEATKTYSLVLTDIGTGANHQENRTVTFQPSDFIPISNYHRAQKTITTGNTEVYYTYLPNLKNYINAGGTWDVVARKNNAKNTIKKVVNNLSPTEEEIRDFNNWFGTNLTRDYSTSDISADVKNSVDLSLKILDKANSVFDIVKTNTVTDIVTLGGKPLNLSYSDFGLWTTRGSTEYSGDKDLLNAKKDTDIQTSSYYIDTPFYSGLDEFKSAFTAQPNAGINTTTKFSGNTIAIASKGNIRNDLTGTAILNIDNQTATGNISLSFDKWYGFTFNNIDFSSKDGFALTDTNVSVKGTTSANSSITINSSADTIKGNITGSLYGPNPTTPVEGVGIYNITTGDNVKVDGAFGVKK